MKKILFLLSFVITLTIKGQIIDFNQFDEKYMNDALFQQMKSQILKSDNFTIIPTNKGHRFIYKNLRKNCEKVTLDELSFSINTMMRDRYESKSKREEEQSAIVGLIDSISASDVKTYEEAAVKCLTVWKNDENSFFLAWGHIGNAISYYSIKNQTLYLFFGYFE